MKKWIISAVIVVCALLILVYGRGSKVPGVCSQKYALCSAAQCIPDPNNPERSICFCDVFQGKNYGHSPCSQRKSVKNAEGIEHILSTFSLKNFETCKKMTCPSGNVWSDCLDQPCIIDPLNPKQAICSCKIVTTGEFVTFGGDCKSSTCSTGFWSAATPESNAEGIERMMQALGLKSSPEQSCEKTAPAKP